jgi:GrpB-like predicted nucleotidyltransferase (UPF0157 family)
VEERVGLAQNVPMVTIVEPDARWAPEFTRIATELRGALGNGARRIDHIGSTSVPGLPSKDLIDIQITVDDENGLRRVASQLSRLGWRRGRGYWRDHRVPGLPAARSEWRKVFFDEPEGSRPTHLHVRIEGRANQRYALLFRDYLRTSPDASAAYAEIKRGLAALALDSGSYAAAKDPACDLIYFAAETWASKSGWIP